MGTIESNEQKYRHKSGECFLIQNDDDDDIELFLIEKIINRECVEGRKYVSANKLNKLFKKQQLNFDERNEVVQDLSKYYEIKFDQLKEKCFLHYTHIEDEVYYISQQDLNPVNNYSCRFSVKGDQLFPLISATNLKDVNCDYEITPITKAINDIELHFENEVSPPPPRRNSVKRNLNKSFGNSPSTNNKSILNYSIVSLSEDENEKTPIKLKLRLSKRHTKMNGYFSSPPKVRKSNRSVPRKSYADFISPTKTPTKRRNTYSSEDEYVDQVQRVTPKKQIKKVESSKKQTDTYSTYNRTPKGTFARRSLRLLSLESNNSSTKNSNEENIDVDKIRTKLNSSLRRNIFQQKLEDVKEDSKNIINFKDRSPDKEYTNSNFDESVDTKVLRITLDNLNLNNDNISASDSESDFSSNKRTPRKSKLLEKRARPAGSLNKIVVQPSSPVKTPNSLKTSKSTPKRTPRNTAKLIREGLITPSMKERCKKIKGETTPLMKARSQLHVSYVPESLPCREKEYCDVYNFLDGKLHDGCGGCMYISGVPGTGKTATVTSVINQLQKKKNTPKFTYISVNGMRLTEPRQAYVEILKQLQGKTLSWEQAQNSLEQIFIKQKKMTPVVMLIDELDILCTKRQDVVYNLLDWPTKAKCQLIVITIANTMDLPERLLMSRVTSRLGLTRLPFPAYTYKQLQEIVTKRLCGTDSFNPDAVQFVARKVASISGDARRALDICRRAAEIAEAEGKEQLVNMNHVNEALNAMITQPKVLAIKSCSRLEQLILQSIVAEVERTGVEETTFSDVYRMLITCATLEGFTMVSSTLAQGAVYRLSACRLILADQKCNNIFQKIVLNVSNDDVYYALKRN